MGVMKTSRSKVALALLNNLILSKMLTFAPGKLFASYYTSFIHWCTLQLPVSAQLLSTPSWELVRHSAGSHNHQEEAHRGSITKALRTHGKTLPSYSRHVPRREALKRGVDRCKGMPGTEQDILAHVEPALVLFTACDLLTSSSHHL